MSNPGFASRDIDLLLGVIDARNVREQQSTPRAALILDNYSKHRRIQVTHYSFFRREKHVD